MVLGHVVRLGKRNGHARLVQRHRFVGLKFALPVTVKGKRLLERRPSGAAGVDSDAQSELCWRVRVANTIVLQRC